jgi:hypothetical protein
LKNAFKIGGINMNKNELIRESLSKGNAVTKLAPAWVPRSFLVPGGRLKLVAEDRYALGHHRGGIDERWIASTINADNGPDTPQDEGLSYIVIENKNKTEKILLKEAIDLKGDLFLGKSIMEKHNGWKVLAKFFDNLGPIPFHLHQMEKHAKKVGRSSKPEAYYFPIQLNHNENSYPYTFFGLKPETTKQDIINCIKKWDEGDNRILNYSNSYRLKPGTGWDIPSGILHAPGSLVTYEVQKASDVFAIFQSVVEGKPMSRDLLIKDVPENMKDNMDYIIDMIDWETNIAPDFKKHHYREPKPVKDLKSMRDKGYDERFVISGSPEFSAKELTVFPGRKVVIEDEAAYGVIVMQGIGKINNLEAESPQEIRFGELTKDEFFVTSEAAKKGITVVNISKDEDFVILKHFGPV